MRRTLPIASPPNGFPTLPPKPSRSPRSSAQVTISLCPAPRNSRSPEKHSALNRSSKIPPSPSYSSSCATPPAPLRHTPPAAFSTPVFPLTASTNPANLFSISIAWKILPALTLLFPPARFRRPALASPLHCPSAKNAIMIRGLSIFPLAVHFEILCRLSHNRCDTNQWIIWTPIYLPGIPTPLPAKHSSTWSAATTSASMAPSTPASSSAWSSTTRNSPGFTTSPNSLSALTKRSPPRSLSRPSTPPRPLLWRGKCLSPRNQATISRKNISTPSNAIPPSSLSTPNSPDSSTTSRPTPQVPNFSRIP